MDSLNNLYNTLYLFLKVDCNKELSSQKEILNKRSQEIFNELNNLRKLENKPDLKDSKLKEIKVKIIKEYLQENKINCKPDQRYSTEIFLRKSVSSVRKNLKLDEKVDQIKQEASQKNLKLSLSKEKIRKDLSNNIDSLKGIDPKKALNYATLITKYNLGFKLNLKEQSELELCYNFQKLSNLELKKEKKIKLSRVKQDYISKLDDEKIKVFLENPKFQALAKEIDRDMQKKLTVREFSELIGIDYPNKIITILDDLKKNKQKEQVLGADEIADAYMALFLLQENKVFESALKSLDQECVNLKGEVGALEAAITGPYLAMNAVLQNQIK